MQKRETIVARLVNGSNNAAENIKQSFRIIENAKKEAKKTVKESRILAAKRLLELRRRVKEHAYERASKDLLAEKLNNAAKEQRALERYVNDLKQDCFKLSMMVVQEILHNEFSKSDLLIQKIEDAISSIYDKGDLRILVSPKDINNIKQHFPAGAVEFIANENIAQGNAIIHSKSGNIEFNWHEQFNTLQNFIFSQLTEQSR